MLSIQMIYLSFKAKGEEAFMRVLLTGASGQVGSATLEHWPSPIDLVLIGRQNPTKDFRFVACDLADENKLEALLEATRPDLIVNLAAYTDVERAQTDRKLADQINHKAPAAMARYSAKAGVALIHLSTDYVFNGRSEGPYLESADHDPINTYGVTKAAGEQAISSESATSLIFRTSWVFSATGRNFVKTILELAKKRPVLQVVDDQIGSPTSANLLGRAIVWMIEESRHDKNYWSKHAGLYHLTCSGSCSWYDFAVFLVSEARRSGARLALETIEPVKTANFPTKASRPLNSQLSCAKFDRVFTGFKRNFWQEEVASVIKVLGSSGEFTNKDTILG